MHCEPKKNTVPQKEFTINLEVLKLMSKLSVRFFKLILNFL